VVTVISVVAEFAVATVMAVVTTSGGSRGIIPPWPSIHCVNGVWSPLPPIRRKRSSKNQRVHE